MFRIDRQNLKKSQDISSVDIAGIEHIWKKKPAID